MSDETVITETEVPEHDAENLRAAAAFMEEYRRMDDDYGRVLRDLGAALTDNNRLRALLTAHGIDPEAQP